MNIEYKHDRKLPGESEAFEEWLTRTSPSGDVTEVQRAWRASAEYEALREKVWGRQLVDYIIHDEPLPEPWEL